MDAVAHVPEEFRLWSKSFLDHDVDFLLVGGYAVGLHGYPRTTNDTGFWVDAEVPNAGRVMSAAESLGHPLPPDAIMRLSTHKSVYRLGDPPFRVDLMTSCDGCEWATAWARRVIIDIDGLPVPVIYLEALKAAKRAAGRHKDLDDLENLP